MPVQMEVYMQRTHKLMYPLFGVCFFLSKSAGLQTLYGNINISDMTLASEVKIIGMGVISDSSFEKDVKVVGSMRSKRSHFSKDVHAVGADLMLTDDLVDGDVHVTNYVKRPKLYLQKSHVKGKVVFHGIKQGKVIMDQDSVVESGIENGEVQ